MGINVECLTFVDYQLHLEFRKDKDNIIVQLLIIFDLQLFSEKSYFLLNFPLILILRNSFVEKTSRFSCLEKN